MTEISCCGFYPELIPTTAFSLRLALCSLLSLRCCLMTGRRFLLSHVRCVAIRASTGFLVLLKLFFNRRNLRISNFLVVLMTSCARRDRHVRGQAAECARASNVDVAGSAFQHVPALAAFMTELL